MQFVWMQVGNEKEHQEGKEEQGKRQEEIIADFRLVRRSVSDLSSEAHKGEGWKSEAFLSSIALAKEEAKADWRLNIPGF